MSAKDYENKVRALGCVVCNYLDGSYHVASIHHIESIRDGLSAYAIVPLCYDHHQGPNGVHGLSRRGFERVYKLTEIDLLALVNKALNEHL